MRKNEILELLESYYVNPESLDDYNKSYLESVDLRSSDFKGFISESWSLGGMTGGDCWNSGANQVIYEEDEKEFTTLDNFLKDCLPSFSDSDKEGLSSYIEEQTYNVYESYGNYELKRIKYITYENLINFIKNNNLKCVKPTQSNSIGFKF